MQWKSLAPNGRTEGTQMVVQILLGLTATSVATYKTMFQQPTLSLHCQLILLNSVPVTAPRQIQIVYSMLYFF